MEAKLVLLAQPAIHGSSVSFHHLHSFDVWIDVLGPRLQNVCCQLLENLSSILVPILNSCT